MRLPEWLVKAGARLEEVGSANAWRLYFGDQLVESRGMYELQNRDEIPTVYQVRSCEYDEAGEISKSSFECGLDLVTSKELVWINGAYFDTFEQAFRHLKTSSDFRLTYKEGFYIDEDHFNLVRYQECQCYRLYNDDPCECGADPSKIAYEPPTIKLLD